MVLRSGQGESRLAALDPNAQGMDCPMILGVTWQQFESAVEKLVRRQEARENEFIGRRVYGIPTGGCFIARELCKYGWGMVDDPGHATLIVDDLIDSGETARRILSECGFDDHMFDALYRKPNSPKCFAPDAHEVNGWIKFPWEHDGSPTDAVIRILEFIGEDPKRDGLIDTPARVLKAIGEMTSGYREDPKTILAKTFDVDCDELVIVTGITFTSMCEHHMLPFVGVVDVGYLPGDRVVGLSKIPRLVECFARRLQVQERMTNQIAQAIVDHLDSPGAAVVVRASHSCMACRGVRQANADMVTSAMLGRFRENSVLRGEFLDLCR